MRSVELNWDEFFTLSQRWAIELRSQLSSEIEEIILQPETRQGALLLLGLGLSLGLVLVLDEKRLLQADHNRQVCWDESILPESWRSFLPSLGAAQRAGFSAWDLRSQTFILCTSGSMGQPKLIPKYGRGLLAEIADLQCLYQLQREHGLVSLVSPLHIYGLLHSFLLPMQTGSRVIFAEFEAGLYHIPALKSESVDLLIAVPATWSLVKVILQQQAIATLVMSGAAFGESRQSELMQLDPAPERTYEILGSTETGGIAYRRLDQGACDFHLMPSVEIVPRAGAQLLFSSYIWPAQSCLLSDRLEQQSNGQYRHLGRADRIFKYSGQRYALAAIEQALMECLSVRSVICHFYEDTRIAQGGQLKAFVEGVSG
ncbi:MAG: AMP-binding protein [Proteobacteria bacterium]|nr:AMP-binding protein [Pseudomonadota bacterium]